MSFTEICKWYALVPPVTSIVTLFVDAPFGRFALKDDAWLQVDGAWYSFDYRIVLNSHGL